MDTPKQTSIYIGEQRNGRIKFTTDRDCLPPDVIRFDERMFPSESCHGDFKAVLMSVARHYEARGFVVCIDTDEFFYETVQS